MICSATAPMSCHLHLAELPAMTDHPGPETVEALDPVDETELVPEDDQVLIQRGQTLLELGHPEEAAADAKRAVQLNPSAPGYIVLGQALLQQDRVKESEKAFLKAEELLSFMNNSCIRSSVISWRKLSRARRLHKYPPSRSKISKDSFGWPCKPFPYFY